MLRLARLRIVDLGPRDQGFQDIGQHLRIRTRGQGALLRAAQFGRGDHLHGLGDLPRVDHAADTPADVENVCQAVLSSQLSVLSYTSSVRALTQNWKPRTENFYFATASLCAANCCFASLITFCNCDFS